MAKQKKPPVDFGPIQAPNHLGLTLWRWRLGVHRGLIPNASSNGDLDALREVPGLDWEAARSVRRGQPSPWRHLAVSNRRKS